MSPRRDRERGLRVPSRRPHGLARPRRSPLAVNVAQILRQPALADPDRVAVVVLGPDGGSDRRELSYGALDLAARRVAPHLSPGARVALIAGNGGSFIAAWFGVVYAGATIVPVPVGAALAEVVARVDHAGCDLILADAERLAFARAAAAACARPVAVREVDDLAAGGALAPLAPASTGADDPAMILYTSGTIGRAKGAVISHASLLLHTAAVAHHALRLGPDAVVLGALPLSHSYGCRMVMLASFFAGARCVLLPRFSARGSLAAAAGEGVTWLPAVPTMFAAWGALPEAPALPALRWCLSAGAPLPDALRRRAEERLGVEVREGYGMTEATFSTLNAPPDERVPGSVGRPAWGVEVRVVDAHGVDVPAGAEGELLLRGHNQMLGYLDDPRATAAAQRDGWLRTGDVGRLDDAGRVQVIDRIKDIVLRGGHTIYPAEVEDALATHPDVAAVAVVGTPDPFYGEEIVAVVVAAVGTRPTLELLQAWLVDRLASHKHPRALAVVDSLPLGPSRKVLKRTLRAWLADGTLTPDPT